MTICSYIYMVRAYIYLQWKNTISRREIFEAKASPLTFHDKRFVFKEQKSCQLEYSEADYWIALQSSTSLRLSIRNHLTNLVCLIVLICYLLFDSAMNLLFPSLIAQSMKLSPDSSTVYWILLVLDRSFILRLLLLETIWCGRLLACELSVEVIGVWWIITCWFSSEPDSCEWLWESIKVWAQNW